MANLKNFALDVNKEVEARRDVIGTHASPVGGTRRVRRAGAMRGSIATIAMLALGAFVVASAVAWRARGQEPEDGARGWAFESPAPALDARARAALRAGLDTLHDTTRPARERLAAYRASLAAAESLLVRSLRARPPQARALARLAATRFELDPTSPESARRTLDAIGLAAALAPRSGRVHRELGELLVRMGRPDLGAPYYRRAVELTPERAAGAVGALLEAGLDPAEVLDALPSTSAVLAAAREPFIAAHGPDAYLGRVEARLATDRAPGPELLAAYVDTALAAGAADRLLARLGALEPLGEPGAEAWRRLALGRAELALGRPDAAAEHAEAARNLGSDSLRIAAAAGNLALAAGRPERAIEAFRAGLGLVARRDGSPTVRSRFYARIGAAEEARGDAVAAYDAFAMALRLDPGYEEARRRLERLGGGAPR